MDFFLKPLHSRHPHTKLGDYVTLGSASDCSVRLNHEDISERHARIENRGGKFVLRDLRSNTGTYLNDAQVLEAYLKVGDCVRLGPFEFQVGSSSSNADRSCALTSRSDAWNRILKTIPHVAECDFPVLLLGPSGTGKDVLAQQIHDLSPRSNQEFVSVNCSALTETLIESELFGHVKGSFTGAIQDRKGAFETARGGTLFLDEIGDLPYSLQAKLLRALENKEIRPVGSDRSIKTDVRVIAATHQNLNEKIVLGQFRSDLYYRLNVVQIRPPALVERMEDFEILLMDFAKKFRVRFTIAAIHRMKKYTWPGNIRELKNLVLRAKALYPLCDIHINEVEHLLNGTIPNLPASQNPSVMTQALPLIKEMEKQLIIKRLTVNHGNQKLTALDLGMPKSTLHDRLKDYDIDIRQFRV